MRRIAMGAMALAGLSAFAKADQHHVEECLSSITAAKDYFPSEAMYVYDCDLNNVCAAYWLAARSCAGKDLPVIHLLLA